MRIRSTLLVLFISFCCCAQQATVREYQQSFPTYGFSDPNPIPLLTAVYPYFRFDGFTNTSTDRKWKVVELENAYIRLLILPEIGGKVWAAIEKSTNRPFLYFNHTVKFRDVAMRGPWTSGGLEANYGIIGHTPNCATPVDYLTRVNPDGSVSCIIGNLDLLTRSQWRVEIRLPADQAVFSTSSFWYNGTPLEQPYYQWMNAGLKADGDLEFVYPGNRYLGHEGEYAAWPVNEKNGKKISWYKENDFGTYKSYHVFGKYTDFAGAYWHDDDMGMVRYGTHDERAGKKIWIWGLSRQGMIWEHLLTDHDGQYVELQSGRLFNQNSALSSQTPFKHRSFSPFGTDTWTEYWYPVMGTKGFVAASDDAALNLRKDGEKVIFDICPVRSFGDELTVRAGGKEIFRKKFAFKPLRIVRDSFLLSGIAYDSLEIGLGALRYATSPVAGDLSRPVDAPAAFDWHSAYGYYLKACEGIAQKDYAMAEQALDSSLQKDGLFLPAIVKMAGLRYRNMQYDSALKLAKLALSIHSMDGEANYIYGLVNGQMGRLTDARDGFDIACLDPAWRSAAYSGLARIYILMKEMGRSLECSRKALDGQPGNMEALQLRALAARLAGSVSIWRSSLTMLDSLDPLNHFARSERWMAGEVSLEGFTSLIRDELPEQTYLELGIWYAGCGRPEDAIRVLEARRQGSPGAGRPVRPGAGSPVAPEAVRPVTPDAVRPVTPDAETALWIASLKGEHVNAGSLDPNMVFAFRSETGRLLEGLVAKEPHWFLRYQLALIYKDRNRVKEALSLLRDCGDRPSFAPFYVVRAVVDTTSALRDLERAAQLDGSWRYQKLLAEWLLAHGKISRAENIAGAYYRGHPGSYIMGMLYARALLSNRHYAECDKLLSKLEIIPFEGATVGRELYREAKLMQAVEAMEKGRYKQAVVFIDAAKKWPENLGVGEPYTADQDLRLEEYMSYICQTRLGVQFFRAVPRPSFEDRDNVNTRVLRALSDL